MTDVKTARDVLADKFDCDPSDPNAYRLSDVIITALTAAGYQIVLVRADDGMWVASEKRRPLAAVPISDLPLTLRLDADEMNGWGAGNEAEHARQAADEIERLRAAHAASVGEVLV